MAVLIELKEVLGFSAGVAFSDGVASALAALPEALAKDALAAATLPSEGTGGVVPVLGVGALVDRFEVIDLTDDGLAGGSRLPSGVAGVLGVGGIVEDCPPLSTSLPFLVAVIEEVGVPAREAEGRADLGASEAFVDVAVRGAGLDIGFL